MLDYICTYFFSHLEAKVFKLNGVVYFPLEDLAEFAIGFSSLSLEWMLVTLLGVSACLYFIVKLISLVYDRFGGKKNG